MTVKQNSTVQLGLLIVIHYVTGFVKRDHLEQMSNCSPHYSECVKFKFSSKDCDMHNACASPVAVVMFDQKQMKLTTSANISIATYLYRRCSATLKAKKVVTNSSFNEH